MKKGSLELICDSDDDYNVEEEDFTDENNLELWGETAPWVFGRPIPR